MLSVSFVYLYKRLMMCAIIHDIACMISHHLEVRGKGNFNCCLDLIVYDDSIRIMIEDNCITQTFLIDTFANYITIFHSLPYKY